MSGKRKLQLSQQARQVAGCLLLAVALSALLLAIFGIDTADKLGSVLGLALSAASFALAVYAFRSATSIRADQPADMDSAPTPPTSGSKYNIKNYKPRSVRIGDDMVNFSGPASDRLGDRDSADDSPE